MAERASAITSRIVSITDRLRPQRHGNVDADTLAKEILRHYPEGDAELVRRAYGYAAEAHEGQKRVSGEPYITHPAAVAMLVAELGMDPATVAAALLHDVPEDTAKTVEDVRREVRERYINETMKTLRDELEKAGVRADLSGRAKHLWSIAQKMRRKGVGFEEVYDVLAIRVIVDDVPSCYAALGVVHTLWPPIPGQFDDYIAVPKANMYQSLHTAVIGTGGQPVEIQVRTRDMHDLAEYGIAAHWRYKEGGKGDRDYESKLAWVRQLLEWQHDVADAQEFVESLKVDVFQDQVFVFTPKGEVKGLPAGATPIDFAYRIHTDVGHRTIGAKVNGRIVPLDHRLASGDIVEIVTSKAARGPSRDWLGMVRTPGAREKIRAWFKRAQRDENITHGKELLDKELRRISQRELGDISDEDLRRVTETLNLHDVDTLFASLGYGALTAAQVVTRLGITDDTQLALPQVPPPMPPAP